MKVAIREMYPRIPLELVTDPSGSSEPTLKFTALDEFEVAHFETCLPSTNLDQANSVTTASFNLKQTATSAR